MSEYVEGAVQPPLVVPLENHFQECDACRREMVGIREVWQMLDSEPVMDAPSDLRAQVWARIEAQEAPSAHRRNRSFSWRSLLMPRNLGWAAGVVLLLVFASFAMPGRFTSAGLHFPWSGALPAVSGVSAGPTEIQLTKEHELLTVPLKWQGSAPGSITATVDSGSGRVLQVTPAAIQLEFNPAAHQSITLKVEWSENGTRRVQLLPVHNP